MKLVLQDNNYFVLRFDKGEEVFVSLTRFLSAHNITAAFFNGIGACDQLELSYFDFKSKNYIKTEIKQKLEITSLTGNAAISNGQPALHIHGTFAREDLTAIGGHIFKLVISATCEIFLTRLEGEMKREMDSSLNLNLLV